MPSPCHHRTTTVSRSYRRRTTTHHRRSFYLSVTTRVCFPPTNWVPLAVLRRQPPLYPAPAKHCTRTVRTIPGLHPVSLMCAGSRCVLVLRTRSSDVACVTGINPNPYVPNGWPEQATPESYEHLLRPRPAQSTKQAVVFTVMRPESHSTVNKSYSICTAWRPPSHTVVSPVWRPPSRTVISPVWRPPSRARQEPSELEGLRP